MRIFNFPLLGLVSLSLTTPSPATPLSLPLSTLRATVQAEIPPADQSTARLEVILVQSLTTSLTAPHGSSSNGDAQTRILANEQWKTGATLDFETGNPAAGRYFLGYRALSSDSSRPLTPYHLHQTAGEPAGLFYGGAAQEPIQMGFIRTGTNGGFGLLRLGAVNSSEILVSVRAAQATTAFLTVNFKTPPPSCNTGAQFTTLMGNWTATHAQGLLREDDGAGGTRFTLVYALSDADLRSPNGLEFTVLDKTTGKILADGPMGPLNLPSVGQWIGQYDTRLTGTSSPTSATRIGLAFLAFRGLAHADAAYPGFDFLQGALHFTDYTQMAVAFNAALKLTPIPPTPLGRLARLYTAAITLNQNPLQDPVTLVLKTPKDNVVFADGYTRMEFDTTFSASSPWPGTAGTRDLRLFLLHSKNIALYTRDRAHGPYAFSPLLPAASDTLPAENSPDTNAYALSLPVTGPALRALLKNGIYVRGNVQGIAKPEEAFHLSARIIRDTSLATTARAQVQTVALTLLPSSGNVISGPENSAFQIWPVVDENGTTEFIKNSLYGQYMNRGQTRALTYASEYKLGTGVLMRVDGPDAGKLTALDATHEGEGKSFRFINRVRSGGLVGTGMDGLLFRAVDFTVNPLDVTDTTVLRVFERKGSLFGLGMVIPSAGGSGSPDVWPVVVDRDAVAPETLFYAPGVGLPAPLQQNGTIEIWMDEDTRLYSKLAYQNGATRLNEGWKFQLKTDAKKKTYYSFNLDEPDQYSVFFDPSAGVTAMQAMVSGGQGRKSVRFVYRPRGESGRYLEEVVTTEFNPVKLRARIAGDLVRLRSEREDQINNDDFITPYPHLIKHWYTDYTFDALQKKDVAGAKNYKVTMDMVAIKVARQTNHGYQLKLFNATQAQLLTKALPNAWIFNRAYLFDSLIAPQVLGENQLNPVSTGIDQNLDLSGDEDTLSLILAGDRACNGNLYVQVENDGLFANTDSLNLELTDFNRQMAVYTSRYKRESSQANYLAKEEGINDYTWENGKKLSDSSYNEGTFLQFPLAVLKQYEGRTFARISEFDPNDTLIVSTHGFNSAETMDGTYDAERSFFKKFRLQGFRGNFLAFHWYGDFSPRTTGNIPFLGSLATTAFSATLFAQDQLNAFKSSSAFLSLLSGTLRDYQKKILLVHSLGNQMTMDMLRQNVDRSLPGPVSDLGIMKYVIHEAALATSVMDAPSEYSGDKRKLGNWQGLFNNVPANYTHMQLYHLRRTDDWIVGVLYRANESAKRVVFPQYGLPVQLMSLINASVMTLDGLGNLISDNRIFPCPLLPLGGFRLPRELAICYDAAPLLQFPIHTFPQQGLSQVQWPHNIDEEVSGFYTVNGWKSGNLHSWLNIDEAYKTSKYIRNILQ
jgi:hypothetical protein